MNIALLGYGKMGKTIEQLATGKGHSIVFKKGGDFEEGNLSMADVAIEFSVPEAAVNNIKMAMANNVPVICGTTGWLSEFESIKKIRDERNGSFIYASNFSVGVNLFFSINEYAAKLLAPWQEYNVAITEIHHTQKKDAPSGTAISLADGIIAHSEKKGWSLTEPSEDTIAIEAHREGDIKGTHIVHYNSDIDTITLKHEAHSREGFAYGAIVAAEWILGKKGIFTMKDVLGIEE